PPSHAAGNRVLLFDVENNGRPVAHGMYNSPTESIVRALEVGNGFLEDEGFMMAIASWQNGHGITLPGYEGPEGKTTLLSAVGFAAIRDFAAFLRFDATDRAGTPNPVAARVGHAIAVGSSQTARFLKSFLHHGFNRVGDRMVFDGLHLQVGQVGTMPFMPPVGTQPDVVRATLVGDSAVFPFTYQDVLAPLTVRKETSPKILATNVEGDYYRRRLSLLRTGPSGTADLPLPESVRVWDVAGGSHGIVLQDNCEMPRANLDWHPLMRAGLIGLVRWVQGAAPLPQSRLMAIEPAEPTPFLSPAPTDQPKAVMMVPRRDADGNGEGGVRLPAVAVPVGTYGAWNAPLDNDCGDMSVYWHPFPRSRWQRLMTRDARTSVQERYGSDEEYLRRYRAAADALVRDGYLLEHDAGAMVGVIEARVKPLFQQPAREAR
ncbi:MAG: hypothetical protein LC804_27210, partial [Acidobacteria bacterium]|nr:hypothetical protein [Acidobacteriota bacterium]